MFCFSAPLKKALIPLFFIATLIEACKVNPQKSFEFLGKIIANGPTAEW